MACVHALTYIYQRTTEKAPNIYASPLDPSCVVGTFLRDTLVCDTLLDISGVRWAILHHMMYTPLKLSGIPQAWVVLEDAKGTYFTRTKMNQAFEKRLQDFRVGK